MHIPDGFLDTKTLVAASAFSLAGIGNAIHRLRGALMPRHVPLVALAASFIFVAQMLNFPIGGGTSGHLLGATLAAVLLGPHVAIIVMTLILLVQSFLFADGGVLALGANAFNMALVGSVTGYGLYRGIRSIVPGNTGLLAGAAFGAWGSTVAAAVCCAGELTWSGLLPWSVAFPAMAGIHMLIGVVEAAITSLVLSAILATRPEILDASQSVSKPVGVHRIMDIVVYGGIVTVGLLLFVSPLASRWPDGLESVAAKFGFESRAITTASSASLLAQYHVPGIGSLPFVTALAGAVGAGVVFLLSIMLAKRLAKKSAKSSA